MASSYRFGWIPDKTDSRDKRYSIPAGLGTYPPSVDLRKSPSLLPAIYDQLDLGSCTANGIAALIEFAHRKQAFPDIMPSRLFIYYNERVIEHSVSQDAGASIRDGMKSVNKQGICSETDWPYIVDKFAIKPPAKCYVDAKKDLVLDYSLINNADLNALKGCLVAGFPIVFGSDVFDNFPMDTTTGSIPMPKGQIIGGHCMVIVGYNTKKRFIIRNSWGTGWGAKGYGSIPFAYITDTAKTNDCWTVRLVE